VAHSAHQSQETMFEVMRFVCFKNPLSLTGCLLVNLGNCCSCFLSVEMICEPSHLKRLNSRASINEYAKIVTGNSDGCAIIEEKDDIYFPAFEVDSRKCFLQKDSSLYSCVGQVEGLVRLCSCRNFIPGQTALCRECL
jgi:Glycosyltransferase family 18